MLLVNTHRLPYDITQNVNTTINVNEYINGWTRFTRQNTELISPTVSTVSTSTDSNSSHKS